MNLILMTGMDQNEGHEYHHLWKNEPHSQDNVCYLKSSEYSRVMFDLMLCYRVSGFFSGVPLKYLFDSVSPHEPFRHNPQLSHEDTLKVHKGTIQIFQIFFLFTS